MSYISTIKEGINTVHKNWQLILIHSVLGIFCFVSFFAVVGMLVVIAFIMLGLDFAEILRLGDAASIIQEAFELLNKYLIAAMVMILSLLIYLVLIAILWVFTISGTAGILAKSILNGISRFTFGAFFAEGRRLFSSIYVFFLMVGIMFIATIFMFGIFRGITLAITEAVKAMDAVFAHFLEIFFSLALLSTGAFLVLVMLSIAAYGIAHIAFNRSRPLRALEESIRYIYSVPSAIGFYAVVMLVAAGVGLAMILIIGPQILLMPEIDLIPLIAYQIIVYTMQVYIGIIVISSVFRYCYKTRSSSPFSLSTGDPDISQKARDGQAPLHLETAESRQR
ncbi:hypothetical protein M1N62_04115 [Thermodesulfovibrionales bacterium]|nr:hypothetical protein [Thermodesulfovibrionales bacterium]MCL0071115.1 hypothetical protein [Thermodesulfovibrionales bacterium]